MSEAELNRHIGWDIGILGVTSRLADLMAAYVYQPYSRLVIDCNRQIGSSQSIMVRSDGTDVPGNRGLTEADKVAREVEIMRPYHDAIDRLLDRRQAANMPTAIICMHSCTPRLAADRNFDRGISASSLITTGGSASHCWRCSPRSRICVGRNEPYNVDIEVDYTVPVHCEEGGCPMSRSRSARI